MTSPAAPRRPPLLHSPFVPSIMRCDSAEDEDKRQRIAARCALQQANVAWFVCAVILRRIIVEALPRTPPGDAGRPETKAQEVRRHTGVVFTRVHARLLYEVVAPAQTLTLTLTLTISFQRTRASSKIALSKPSSTSRGGPSIAICNLASKMVVLIRFDNFVMTRAMTEKPRSQSTELRNSTRHIATRMAISEEPPGKGWEASQAQARCARPGPRQLGSTARRRVHCHADSRQTPSGG